MGIIMLPVAVGKLVLRSAHGVVEHPGDVETLRGGQHAPLRLEDRVPAFLHVSHLDGCDEGVPAPDILYVEGDLSA